MSSSDLELHILTLLASSPIADTQHLATSMGVDHQALVGCVKSLEADEYVRSEVVARQEFAVTPEGREYVETGSPEFQVWRALPAGGELVDMNALNAQLSPDLVKIGFSQGMQRKWFKTEKRGKDVFVGRASEDVVDTVVEQLRTLSLGQPIDEPEFAKLKKRNLASVAVVKSFSVTKGPQYRPQRAALETDLTAEMLASGSWENASFKKYNFAAAGKPIESGYFHPLLKVRTEIRQIFFEMGFEEMPTNRFVESGFWNFDALFQPQQHPARDLHDTFYVSSPAEALTLPEDYVEKVKAVHEVGGYGSIGYRYKWALAEAKKNLLRTHTTAVSSRMLKAVAEEPVFRPRKFFSIDRVFRNEDMDQTHLCEFHQIEGMVIDRNLCLGDMIGLFANFFEKIGITQLKFKPAYNPYTEPSMEIFGFHPGLGKWVEIGNSGIFRPEMLLPMGLPEDVTVIAWGLSLERPTMIKYGLDNIRDLMGHKVDLHMIRHSTICRMDKV
nr:phenylalanine-tRNA ligase alpha subunit [Seculamonas ecuadoriensis]